MVDYFPLLARAVSALSPNTSEQRRVLYDRARKTLVDKLRNPALSHADLRAESAALEAAIQRVERDTVSRAAPPQPKLAYRADDMPAREYRGRPPLKDVRKPLRIAAGAFGALLILMAGVATYSYWPRILSGVRSVPSPRSVAVITENPETKSNFVRLRQLVYYRTNQPVGTIIVDKSQDFLYVVRPNASALRYSIGVGAECITLAGLYHVVRKESPGGNEPARQSADALGARVIYLDKDYRIHGSNASTTTARPVSDGCIRLDNDDVVYLYDRTPLESRVVVSN
jgi:lipoprotein-anchoring transpeptidase ErfK/SrfK